MENEYTQDQQDANVGESSEAPESNSAQQAPEQDVSAEQKQTSASEDQLPFHEHPRFKELVEQKNRAMEQSKALEERYAQLESQLRQMQQTNQPKKEENPLYSRLKGIDPEFGGEFEKVASSLKELQELKQWKTEFEQNQQRNAAVATVKSLHEQNKVSPELRSIYESQLELAYARNPQAFLKDIQGQYKAVHESMMKVFEARDRAARESYVSSKKADASIPSPSKGKNITSSKEFKYSDDPAEARQQLVKRTLELMRAESE